MPDESSPNLPAPRNASQRALDRAAVERVLARAGELQRQDGAGEEPSETLSEEQIVELGKEVGLSPAYLRQALAEERTRVAVPPERGLTAAIVGPGLAGASRTVRGTPAAILGALEPWMERQECLRVKRRFPDRLVWEPGGGVMQDVGRWLNLWGRGYHLRRAAEVSATVVAVDEQRSLVRLDADLRHARSASIGSSAASLGAGTVVGAAAIALGVMVPVAIVPALALGGGGTWAARRNYHRSLTLVQLALEQILDRLEHGEIRVAGTTAAALVSAALDALSRRR